MATMKNLLFRILTSTLARLTPGKQFKNPLFGLMYLSAIGFTFHFIYFSLLGGSDKTSFKVLITLWITLIASNLFVVIIERNRKISKETPTEKTNFTEELVKILKTVVEDKNLREKLKLSGIGNGLVKTLSSIFELVTDMSKKVFKSASIFDSLNSPNLLKSILMYIETHKISINDFNNNFGLLMDTISKLYLKTGKLDDFKNKLFINTQKSTENNILSVNEFNL